MNKLPLLLLTMLLGIPQFAMAQAYKCKQADGSLAFQDHPCQGGATGSMVGLPPVQGYSAGSTGQAGAPGDTSQASSGHHKHLPGGDRDPDTERANAETRAYNAQVMADNKAKRCEYARQQLDVVNAQRPIYSHDSAGNRVYVDDKDRPAAVAAAQERVGTECQ